MAALAFETFVETLRHDDTLSLPLQDLAATAGAHRNTVRSHPESPKLQHYLREMLRVMSAASASQSDFNRVLFWFKNVPIP